MIISHKHKFIFVKTKKTAGTSVEIALSKICGDDDIITPISKKDEKARIAFANRSAQNYLLSPIKYNKLDIATSIYKAKPARFYNHIRCREIRRYVSDDIWNNYYKFSIDRNPFDQVVSLYYYRGGDEKYNGIYEFLVNGGLKKFTNYDIYSIDGVVAVDKVYTYENLGDLCTDLTQKLNLDDPLEMPSYRAKSKIRKVNDYKDVLDQKTIDLIKVIFAREIALLGYEY
ncbi:MAG: hypothetical protein WEC59_09715 [Salibacteraceae bacterium]